MFLKKKTTVVESNHDVMEAENNQANSPLPPNSNERRIKQDLLDALFNSLDLSLLETLPTDQARSQISETAAMLLLEQDVPLNAESRKRVIEEIGDEILGLGPLEPLLKDKTVSDILVNSHSQIYVERKGKLESTDATFRDDSHLLNVIDRIVSQVGRRIDESSPMVDARLKDGSRVNAIIPPLALDGPILSIRRFAVNSLELEDLINYQTLVPEIQEILQGIVKISSNKRLYSQLIESGLGGDCG